MTSLRLRALIAAVLVLSGGAGYGQAQAVPRPHDLLQSCPANIPGKTQHWAIALCEAKAGTDDMENEQVQACITTTLKRDKVNMETHPDCGLNTAYKRAWCDFLVKNKYERTTAACMKSTKNIPDVVSKGGA